MEKLFILTDNIEYCKEYDKVCVAVLHNGDKIICPLHLPITRQSAFEYIMGYISRAKANKSSIKFMLPYLRIKKD